MRRLTDAFPAMTRRRHLATIPDARVARDQVSLQAAVDAFLAQPDLATSTRRSYAQTLQRLATAAGASRPLASLDAGELEGAALAAWGQASAATWNRHAATLGSFQRYCARRALGSAGVSGSLARRREHIDRTRAIPQVQLERFLARPGHAPRERALWRLLYESAARATEVLTLNVEDVDLDNRRARASSKGGDIEWLHFQTAGARLLPRLIDGRRQGPLFLANRAPAPARAPAAADHCPTTGRARLSYRRAAEQFKAASGGWTLHQLRHSALTHLAEEGVGLPLLMAKSRHSSLRSLQRYARPGPEAVAALTAASDPARRRT